jgi:hypothetical protein
MLNPLEKPEADRPRPAIEAKLALAALVAIVCVTAAHLSDRIATNVADRSRTDATLATARIGTVTVEQRADGRRVTREQVSIFDMAPETTGSVTQRPAR